MLFTEVTFFVFFTVAFSVYWLLGTNDARKRWLLACSCVFYGAWDWRFLLLLAGTTLVDYLAARWMEHAGPAWRKLLLVVSLALNLGVLAFFKYFNFFVSSGVGLASLLGLDLGERTLEIILPVGISFYTFQTMSYTIDVYRGDLKACKSLVDFCAFVAFFPQLVAGPIERASNLLPQFERERRFDEKEATDGLRLMLWGFFKKLVLADGLAPIVNARFGDVAGNSGPQLLLATICFAFQIYCDFSAYSDIAIGTGKQFGITLMRNFNYPYLATNLSDFWRRWHISLSTWLRDYVYFPLGGSRGTAARCSAAILLTFLISGFWHGAAWHFVAWGLVHGIAVAATRGRRLTWLCDRFPRASHAGAIAVTFAFVCLTWILFRAATLGDAWTIIAKIAIESWQPVHWRAVMSNLNIANNSALIVLVLFIGLELWSRKAEHPLQLAEAPLPLRWAVYTLLIWCTLELMPLTSSSEFIYFQF